VSLDLDDIKRLKLTKVTLRWLKAEAEKTGFSPQEVAREKLHRLAVAEIHASRLLCDATSGEDISRDSRGRKYDKDDGE
jgi:hypothetical protein